MDLCVCVTLCVESVLEVKWEIEEKKLLLESPGKSYHAKILKKGDGWKEILKNNTLIKLEFCDAESIVKWYGISNKVAFWDGKIE